MFRTAWMLPAFMLFVLIVAALLPQEASAADGNPFSQSKMAFKDLPGVVPQEQRVDPNAYKCTSDIEDVYRFGSRFGILDQGSVPTRVYRCEAENGITYTGTQMPNTQWVPGLNPHFLPK